MSATLRVAFLSVVVFTGECVCKEVEGLGLVSLGVHIDGAVTLEAEVEVMLVMEDEHEEGVGGFASRVSNPKHVEYGQYASAEKLRELHSANTQCAEEIKNWLPQGAPYKVAPHHVTATLPTLQAAALLNTSFRTISINGRSYTRSTANRVTVPECVKGVLGVFGLPPMAWRAPRAPPTASEGTVTPSTLRSQYHISDVINRTATTFRAAVELSGELVNTGDVSQFFKDYVSNAQPGDDKLTFVGQYTPGDSDNSLMEVEYMMGVTPGVATQYWSLQGDDFCKQLLSFLSMAAEHPAGVYSLSYGWAGDLSLVGCSLAVQKSVDVALSDVASRGSTVVMASGDGGSGMTTTGCTAAKPFYYNGTITKLPLKVASTNQCCQACGDVDTCQYWTVNVSNVGAPSVCTMYSSGTPIPSPSEGTWSAVSGSAPLVSLYPSWPSTSQFVTSVGGTTNAGGSEVSARLFGSGGGISEYDTLPGWQADAVDGYFKQAVRFPPNETYPARGRGVPDVSLLSEGYTVVIDGRPVALKGTEASVAVFAGMISALNSYRESMGRPSLGAMNPWLYTNASHAFKDITRGDNAIDSFGNPLAYGFYASKGWDPVTGLGSPNFAELVKHA